MAIPAGVMLSDEVEKVYNINLEETVQSGEEAKASTEDVTGAVTGALDKGEKFVETLTESLAVLIVTTCVIPLITVLFFLWLIKMCIGLDFGGLFRGRFVIS